MMRNVFHVEMILLERPRACALSSLRLGKDEGWGKFDWAKKSLGSMVLPYKDSIKARRGIMRWREERS